MKIPNPVILIILFYMTAQSILTRDNTQLVNFLIGSLFLLGVITMLCAWTGDLFIDFKTKRREE